jgi:hypothetical protein
MSTILPRATLGLAIVAGVALGAITRGPGGLTGLGVLLIASAIVVALAQQTLP